MDFPREAIEPKAIASRGGGSVPEVLRKPIATCDFPWGVQNPCPPLPPSGSTHAINHSSTACMGPIDLKFSTL